MMDCLLFEYGCVQNGILAVGTLLIGIIRPPRQPHLAHGTEHVTAGGQEHVVPPPVQFSARLFAASASQP